MDQVAAQSAHKGRPVMPKKGVNILAVLLASIAIFMIGFLFYGVLFKEMWTQHFVETRGAVAPGDGVKLTGDALALAVATIPGQLAMPQSLALGFLVAVLQALGLGALLRLTRPASLLGALRTASLAWGGFTATALAYNVVYSGEPREVFLVDLAHTLLAFLVGAVILYFVDGRTRTA
jgi:hypothetical protein